MTWTQFFKNPKERSLIRRRKESISLIPTALTAYLQIGQLTVLAPSSARNTASAPVKPQIAVTMDGNCLAGSIVTTPAESRYVPIEGETLTVVHDLHQTRYYVLGCTNLTVTTEIKPLVKILSDKVTD